MATHIMEKSSPCIRMYSPPYDLKMRLNGQKEIQQCVFVNLSMFLRLCFLLESPFIGFIAKASIYLLFGECVASSLACGKHPVHPPHLCFVACSFFFSQNEVESEAVWGNHLLVSRCYEHWFSKLLDKKQSASMQS